MARTRISSILTLAAVIAVWALPAWAQQEDPYALDPQSENSTLAEPASAQAETSVEDPAPAQPSEATQSEQAQGDASVEELPQTASPLALLALIGAGASIAGAGLRLARRKIE